MVGRGLKKYAGEIGLKAGDGVVYGTYRGYALSFEEGSGWKSLCCSAFLDDANVKETLRSFLEDPDFMKAYRITGHSITNSLICVAFLDNPGTINKIKEFVDIFCDRLTSCGVKGADYCSVCGERLGVGDEGYAVMNGKVFTVHSGCLQRMAEECEENAVQINSSGNVFIGAIGAVIGGIIGAVPWGIASYFGWFVGWLGFLIGIAAKKGYEFFKGKETKAKAIVVLIVTVLTVLAAEFTTVLISWIMEISADPSLSQIGLTVFDVARSMVDAFMKDSEFRTAMIADIVLGWLFAGLGIFSSIKEMLSSAKANTSIPKRIY